jgi:hypothetical protein
MKSFVTKVIIFFLPLIIAYPFLDARLAQIPNYFSEKKEFIESQLTEIEALTMGSSQGNSINPQFFNKEAFNLSSDSQDLYYDMRLIEKYIERMPNLQLVIIPISYFSLEYRIDHSQSSWRTFFYKLIWGIPPQEDYAILQAGFYSYVSAYGWSEVQNYLQNGFESRIGEKMMPNGWRETPTIILEESPEKELQVSQTKIKPDEGIMNSREIARNITWLQKIINLCHSRKVNVVFITTPVHHYYSDHVDPATFLRMQNEIAQLARNNGVKYFNFLKDERFSAADFYNRDHLNNQGCEKFTKILSDEIYRNFSNIK